MLLLTLLSGASAFCSHELRLALSSRLTLTFSSLEDLALMGAAVNQIMCIKEVTVCFTLPEISFCVTPTALRSALHSLQLQHRYGCKHRSFSPAFCGNLHTKYQPFPELQYENSLTLLKNDCLMSVKHKL